MSGIHHFRLVLLVLHFLQRSFLRISSHQQLDALIRKALHVGGKIQQGNQENEVEIAGIA